MLNNLKKTNEEESTLFVNICFWLVGEYRDLHDNLLSIIETQNDNLISIIEIDMKIRLEESSCNTIFWFTGVDRKLFDEHDDPIRYTVGKIIDHLDPSKTQDTLAFINSKPEYKEYSNHVKETIKRYGEAEFNLPKRPVIHFPMLVDEHEDPISYTVGKIIDHLDPSKTQETLAIIKSKPEYREYTNKHVRS
ncbi:hypothetical protein DFA_04191 [Cavenderia fasciculata]|uniref:Uncharacterized protein n=1 Tax=Cavenderia fasciculata TaxID=261658 RepID=F4Q1J4_CACFS|nr:uncharacterized protein DFA_04191 [Cavenderia fasciculata]EGG18695.1 hypothetical protein DFA_04191 [Cavenderia fasciculata]|eukprot:XP_004366599.1 hypothetical protein DFA_04191 [Cavenderia fasciculata]